MSNSIDWPASISAFCSVVSLIAIFILVKERKEKQRPYLQVSFELVRSSLVCLVIRNVGDVPAKLKGVNFNPSFVEQLPLKARERAKDRDDLNVSVYPKQKWIICLDEIASRVINYQNTRLEITILYDEKGKNEKGKRKPKYKEKETVEFNDYSGFLVYISEIDELAGAIGKLDEKVEIIGTALKQLANDKSLDLQMCTYANMSDVIERTMITGGEGPIILERTEDNQNGGACKKK